MLKAVYPEARLGFVFLLKRVAYKKVTVLIKLTCLSKEKCFVLITQLFVLQDIISAPPSAMNESSRAFPNFFNYKLILRGYLRASIGNIAC